MEVWDVKKYKQVKKEAGIGWVKYPAVPKTLWDTTLDL